jgi:hypothetical protein
MKTMDFFKATDGQRWYVSVDGGETFELCRREPFLQERLAAPLDDIPVNDSAGDAEVSLSREQLKQRGFSISKVTA